MKKKVLIRVFCFMLIITVMLSGNIASADGYDNINFNNISIEEGLSQATVSTIIQDKKGYIWIGTNDGLNRYNGTDFKVYRHERNNKDSIIDNYIVMLEEDLEGNIWVGTTSGVSKINSEGEVVKNYIDDEKRGNLSHYNIWDIMVTKTGEVIISSDLGVDIYNKDTDSFEKFVGDIEIHDKLVYAMDEDKNGDLWFGTKNGVVKILVDERKIERFLYNDSSNSDLNIESGAVYCDDNFTWVGSFANGASKININTGEVIDISSKITGEDKLGDRVKSFYRDSNNIMWIGSNNGLLRYNEEENEYKLHQNKIYNKRSLINDYIYTIIEDKTGLLWVGTYSGISTFDLTNTMDHYGHDPFDSTTISENMIQAIYEDDDELLWIGTNSKGIDIIDKDGMKIKNISAENNESMKSNNITDIDGYKDNIFVATRDGVLWINKRTKKLKRISQKDGLVSDIVRNLNMDKNKHLWIGTKEGYSVLNIETEEIIDINNVLDKHNVKDKYSGALFQDSDGDYWIGSFLDGGLVYINQSTRDVKTYRYNIDEYNSIINNTIRTVAEDSKGQIWVGTSGGLSRINKETGEIKSYTTEDGLPNNTIYGILIDEDDNPWVSTNLGISFYNVKDGTFNNLDILDGLQSNEFNGEAYFKGKDGRFYFGGINGMNAFYPNEIKHICGINTVQFDEFSVNGVNVKSIDNKVFDYEENNIRIKMFLPDYKHNKNTRYYYNIDGREDSWQIMKGSEVLFSNLAPGAYKFKVVALNNKGTASDVSEVSFKISNPFWMSFPAVLMYISIIILLVLYNKFRVNILDEMVNKRTRELKSQMDKNRELYEKVIQLEVSKNSYFINLSHELRTPLNVSSITEQLITKLCTDGKVPHDKLNYYMSVIRKNNNRLLNLINNLIDISKMENGKYIIQKEEVDIVYLVEEAALSLKEYVENKGIELIIDPEIEEKNVNCDPDDIERCIINLIGNAVKFTEEGGSIYVDIKELDKYVQISITDTGSGIDEKFVEVIFDRFNQVVDNHSESHGGSGLGLTITKQIIDLHNGDIYVESKLGVGSKFIIQLPIE